MKYSGFRQIIEEGKNRYGDKPALKLAHSNTDMTVVSYRELYEMVNERIRVLSALPGSCVGLCGPTSIEWIVDLFAAPIAGKRTVLLDSALPKERIQALIDEYEIEAILPVNVGYRTVPVSQKEPEYPGCILVFTSGTTASNKAVVLSQKALALSAWNGQQMLACGPDDVIVSMLPLNHVFGLVCTLLWPLSFGASVGIGRGMRYYTEDPSVYHTTILVTVPTLLTYLFGSESIPPECHTVLVGAAPCSRRVLSAVQAKGIRVSFGYGLSETASGLAISVDADDPFALDLCPDTSVTISDEGEVLVATPCMMEGYWHRPNETEAVLQDGILHTGDLGTLDEKHRLHIRGRKNDVLVLYNGEKIFCPEWEAELSKDLGNEIALVIMYDVLTLVVGGGADEALVRQTVDAFNQKHPISRKICNIRIIEGALPRNAAGKLQRWKVEELL